MAEVRVTRFSRQELEWRRAELLGLLEVFLAYTQDGIEQELAEVRFLLGEREQVPKAGGPAPTTRTRPDASPTGSA